MAWPIRPMPTMPTLRSRSEPTVLSGIGLPSSHKPERTYLSALMNSRSGGDEQTERRYRRLPRSARPACW